LVFQSKSFRDLAVYLEGSNRDWIDDYIKVVVTTCERFGTGVLSIKTCKSKRKGLHFYIHVSPSMEARLANKLQWLLGDDSARVDFNRARIDSGLNEWNKLFEVSGRRLTTVYECPWR